MQVIGITGSAGTGKSTISRQLRLALKVPVWDADQTVRELYQKNSIVIKSIKQVFPSVVKKGLIDLSLLRKNSFSRPDTLETLEKIIYPHLRQDVQEFISQQYKEKRAICVLDIPLLFEKGWNVFCCKTIVLWCDKNVQKERLRKRGLKDFQIENILKNQLSMEEKIKLADYSISSNSSKYHMFQQLRSIIQGLC
jgi:dephospho-CoA kinase